VNGLNALQYAEIGTRRRLASGVLVALLHLLVVLALLHMVTAPQRPFLSREMIIRLTRPAPQPSGAETAPPLPTLVQPLPENFQTVPPSPPLPVPSLDLRGFGQRLFGCAPEALAGLTPQERSRCSKDIARPDDNALLMPRSHVKDPVRRAAETAAKNTPGRIPCSYIAVEKSFGYQVPAASLDCLYKGVTGADLAPLTGLEK